MFVYAYDPIKKMNVDSARLLYLLLCHVYM